MTRNPSQSKHYEMPESAFEAFVQYPSWMMYADFEPETVRVYLALWSHADPNDEAPVVWPSVKRIAWLSHLGPTRTREAIKELQDAGLLLVKGRMDNGGGANQYLLHKPSREEIEALVHRRKRKSLTSDDAKTRSLYQASPRGEGGTSRREGGTSRGEGVPRVAKGGTSPRGAEVEPRTRTKNKNQEQQPGTTTRAPACGGDQARSQVAREEPQATGTNDCPSGENPTPPPPSGENPNPARANDFSSLRARLERHAAEVKVS